MRRQPFRLPAETAGPFLGAAIDRSRPIRLRLDGRSIEGFAGDTVLSAALAAGIDTLGSVDGSPLALSYSAAPAVQMAGSTNALPMERTPATDGAEYRTGARKPLLHRLLGGSSLNLDHHPASGPAAAGAESLPRQHGQADLVVVGAGIAGLSAALAAAKSGLSVMVLEARPQAGGYSVLFGRQEGEDHPETAIAALLSAAADNEAITLVTGAEVFAARSGLVQAHAVRLVDGKPQAHLFEIETPRIILATGSLERLPIFTGNRLPRVRGVLEAFELGWHYGIWPGRESVVATVSSVAYRLAMLAADAGVRVNRVLDTRAGPESRFIAFSRAYGITQAPGARIAGVTNARGRLQIRTESALGGARASNPDLTTGSLVACGGWQPDLTLWNGAGGFSRWQPSGHRLEATGTLDGIALAGSAAGWLSRTACAASGGDAVAALLGRPRQGVQELSIDPVYDTPDDPASIASTAGEASFLAAGRHLFRRPVAPSRAWPWQRQPAAESIAETPQPLDVGTVVASVQLGMVPADSAGAVAQERTGLVLARTRPAEAPTPHPPVLLPEYLVGRFGGRGQLWLVRPTEGRTLDPGGLIQPNADTIDPLVAIGVVVRPMQDGALALLDSAAVAGAGSKVILRESTRLVPLTLVAPFAEEADLGAALSGDAGAP